jgi:hypothetical protein
MDKVAFLAERAMSSRLPFVADAGLPVGWAIVVVIVVARATSAACIGRAMGKRSEASGGSEADGITLPKHSPLRALIIV